MLEVVDGFGDIGVVAVVVVVLAAPPVVVVTVIELLLLLAVNLGLLLNISSVSALAFGV